MIISTKSGRVYSAHSGKESSNQQTCILGKYIPNTETGELYNLSLKLVNI